MWFQYIFLFHSRLNGHRCVLWMVWKFANENQDRSLLFLSDEHLTHISLSVIKRAMEERITIIKFPPHVTDVPQPLDVVCFGPLKRRWEMLLQERVKTYGAKSNLTKPDFVNQICKIWKEGMNSTNIINGFASTGNFAFIHLSFDLKQGSGFGNIMVCRWRINK